MECRVTLYPEGSLGREFIELALHYIREGYRREGDVLVIDEVDVFAERLRSYAETLRKNKVPVNKAAPLTANDKMYSIGLLREALGLSEDADILSIITRFAEIMREKGCDKELFEKRYNAPQLFKLNYFKDASLGLFIGRDNKAYPHREINTFSYILGFLGALLAYLTYAQYLYYLLHPSGMVMSSDVVELHSLGKGIYRLLQAKAPSSVISARVAAAAAMRGLSDTVVGRLVMIQGGKRFTLMSCEELSTHGLVALFRRADIAGDIARMIDAVRTFDKSGYPSLVVRVCEGLLLYASTCGRDVLYSIVALLKRVANTMASAEHGLPDYLRDTAVSLRRVGVEDAAAFLEKLSSRIALLATYCPLEKTLPGLS